jgi:flavin reductase (DIM6/NTAB) family NADH-FMN oxidoreductase RutF
VNLMSSSALQPVVTAHSFKRAAGHWATGVAVITAFDANDRPQGLTMSAVTSLSLEPMLFLICVDLRSSTLPAISHSRCFTINILAEHQAALCGRFASKLADKFTGVEYQRSAWGPVLPGSLATLSCEVAADHPGGDHQIIIGRVADIQIAEQAPLTHYLGRLRSAGRVLPAEG